MYLLQSLLLWRLVYWAAFLGLVAELHGQKLPRALKTILISVITYANTERRLKCCVRFSLSGDHDELRDDGSVRLLGGGRAH